MINSVNKLIVFGGMNDESYIGSVLFIVNLGIGVNENRF
jgi:hypothetical protein